MVSDVYHLLLGTLTIALLASPAAARPPPKLDYRSGALSKDAPQAVFATDPDNPWNQIFYCLFTRRVELRLSEDFQEGAPFTPVRMMGFPQLPVSERSFARIESGDRAIEPLYPAFFSSEGPFQVLAEPRFSQLKRALTAALREQPPRPPLARALMQSDAWAAYDILARNFSFDGEEGTQRRARRDELLTLLAKFIKSLALSKEAIEDLPDNYSAAARVHGLPDVLAAEGEWLEVRWRPERIHDHAADYRRVARVFLKPATPPADKAQFVNSLPKAPDINRQLEAIALVIQNLLIDESGKVVSSHLTYDVQFRRFVRDAEGKFTKTELRQLELSRKLLLSDPKSGGLIPLGDKAPAYMPDAGNDYGFASVQRPGVGQVVLVPLATRCASCHGKDVAHVFTFSAREPKTLPPVIVLKASDNEAGRYASQRKMEREDFKALIGQWERGQD